MERAFQLLQKRSALFLFLLIALLFMMPASLFLEFTSVHYDEKMLAIKDRIAESREVIKVREERLRAILEPLLWQEVLTLYELSEGRLSKELLAHLVREAKSKEIPPQLLLGLIKVESNYDPVAIGPETPYGRAYGLCQFMENTAPWIANMAGLEYDFQKLFDPYYSITLAVTYLNYLQYGDGKSHYGYHDWHATLTAYNRGISGLKDYMEENNTAISAYSNEIMKLLPSEN